MQVEISLAESLINAIANGRVRGVQFKRGWGDESATFDDLNAVIAQRLDGARRVAIETAMHQFADERGMLRLRRAELRVQELERQLAEMMAR